MPQIPKELNTEVQIGMGLSIRDLAFVGIYAGVVTLLTRGIVYEALQPLYVVFNVIIGLVLTVKSPYNPQKRIYQSILCFLRREKGVYKPIKRKEDKEA